MYTEQKNNKKLKTLYEQSLHIKSAIPHPLIMGVIRGMSHDFKCGRMTICVGNIVCLLAHCLGHSSHIPFLAVCVSKSVLSRQYTANNRMDERGFNFVPSN